MREHVTPPLPGKKRLKTSRPFGKKPPSHKKKNHSTTKEEETQGVFKRKFFNSQVYESPKGFPILCKSMSTHYRGISSWKILLLGGMENLYLII